MLTTHVAASADTFVYRRFSRRNYSSRVFMSAGWTRDGYLGYALINFPVRGRIPAGAAISGGELRLHIITSVTSVPSPKYGVYRIQQVWQARSVNWTTRPIFESTPIAVFAQPALGPFSVDISPLVEDWQTGKRAQLGLAIAPCSSFSANTFIRSATREALNSDTWPRLKIDYSVPAVSIGTITPQFINDSHTLMLPSSGSSHHDQDVSLMNPVSVWVTNSGPGAVAARILLSPDGLNYVAETATTMLPPGHTVALVSGIFSRFIRVSATNTDGGGAVLHLYYQGHIG